MQNRKGRWIIILLIIADDFTGALDTAVQFAACGINTRVSLDVNLDFTTHNEDVLVVDTETRHLSAGMAYDAVAELTRRAKEAGIHYIYKKTDSALRGNIGAELDALLNASGCKQLPFLPSFPQIGRIVRDGVLYIEDVPVSESPFGMDPFSPVKNSIITNLIAEQSGLPACSFPALISGESLPSNEGILVFDAETMADFYNTGRGILKGDQFQIMAGCAGFAAILPDLLGIAEGKKPPVKPMLDPRLLVICGSVNPITLSQLDYAEKAGFKRLNLTPKQKLNPNYWKSEEGLKEIAVIEDMLAANDRCIIETNDPDGNQLTALGINPESLRLSIAGSLGDLLASIFTSPSLGTLLLTGGDTLLQCMNSIGIENLEPICELEKGIVLAGFNYKDCKRYVITKSGGFGQETIFVDLAENIRNMEE